MLKSIVPSKHSSILPKIIRSIWWSGIILSCNAKDVYQQDPRYGEGQSAGFINAMYGSSVAITPEETRYFNSMENKNSNNKFFLRLGTSYGNNYLNKFKNFSNDPVILSYILTEETRKIPKQRNFEIAWGYIFNKFSGEIEILLPQNLKYHNADLFQNHRASLSSVINSKILLLRGFYDISNFEAFNFFIGMGLGLGFNRNEYKFDGIGLGSVTSHLKKQIIPAYDFSIGCKLKVASQLFLGANLRTTGMGGFNFFKKISTKNLIWQDYDGAAIIKSKRSFWGISFSLIHIFG